jgi:hypothetical protein
VEVHGSPFDAKTASTEEPETETWVKPEPDADGWYTEPISEKDAKKIDKRYT